MSIFDSILGQGGTGSGQQTGQAPDVANLAAKVGLSPDLTERAIAALGMAHRQPGDTIAGASAQTGIDQGVMGQIVQHIGGEGSLSAFADMVATHPAAKGMLGKLDRDADGSIVDDLGDMAKGMFGRK